MSRHAAAKPPVRPWPTLTPLGPQGAIRPIRVGREVCLVGSHSRVHLPLRSPVVSRVHALIVCDKQEAYIRDLASRHGVFISGSRIREGRLRDGDILCLGPFAFRWSITWGTPQLKGIAPATPTDDVVISAADGSPARRFSGRTVLIGSREECDLLIDGTMVDPVHAAIYRKDNRHFLRDLNSRSGTFVNSRRTRDTEIRPGDEIRVGLTFLRIGEQDAAAEKVTRPAMNSAAGLLGAIHAEQPVRRAPTIEELLGALPDTEPITFPMKPEDSLT